MDPHKHIKQPRLSLFNVFYLYQVGKCLEYLQQHLCLFFTLQCLDQKIIRAELYSCLYCCLRVLNVILHVQCSQFKHSVKRREKFSSFLKTTGCPQKNAFLLNCMCACVVQSVQAFCKKERKAQKMPLYFGAHYSATIFVSSLKTPCLRSQILCVYFSVVLSGCTKALLMFVFSIESVQCFLSSIHKLFQFNKVENIIQTNPV